MDPRRIGRFDWERALRAGDVTGTRLLVLLVLGTYMDEDGTKAHPGERLLADATGLSTRAVRQHLAGASQDGWLVLKRRGHRLGNGTPLASEWAATAPSTGIPVPVEELSTGSAVPVEGDLYRNPRSGRGDLNRNENASQPEPPFRPPIISHHSEKTTTSEITVTVDEPQPKDDSETDPLWRQLSREGVQANDAGLLCAYLRRHEGTKYRNPAGLVQSLANSGEGFDALIARARAEESGSEATEPAARRVCRYCREPVHAPSRNELAYAMPEDLDVPWWTNSGLAECRDAPGKRGRHEPQAAGAVA